MSKMATYSNNSISRNEAVGAIQFIECMSQRRPWHWEIQCHARDSESSHSGYDRAESSAQRSGEAISTGTLKHSDYYGDNNSPNDHVLERHHAVLVRAQTLHRFAGLGVKLQH